MISYQSMCTGLFTFISDSLCCIDRELLSIINWYSVLWVRSGERRGWGEGGGAVSFALTSSYSPPLIWNSAFFYHIRDVVCMFLCKCWLAVLLTFFQWKMNTKQRRCCFPTVMEPTSPALPNDACSTGNRTLCFKLYFGHVWIFSAQLNCMWFVLAFYCMIYSSWGCWARLHVGMWCFRV